MKGAKVDDLVAQPHPGTGVAVSRRENAKWQVGKGEIVPSGTSIQEVRFASVMVRK